MTAIGTLIGAVFGAGGGNEARSAQFLSALQLKLGAAKGLSVWNDLREHMDAETPVTVSTPFPYDNGPTGIGAGNVAIDAGSFQPVVAGAGPLQHRQLMSNALLVGAKRSANGHPIFVAGPQVGYYSPEILMELDLHGGGLNARGVVVPGARLLPPDRPRAGLRVERDLGELRRDRRVRRDALRQRRDAVLLQGPVPRRWAPSTPAR